MPKEVNIQERSTRLRKMSRSEESSDFDSRDCDTGTRLTRLTHELEILTDVEEDNRCCGNGLLHRRRFSPRVILAVAYFCAGLLFLMTINLPEMPCLPFPITGNLLPELFQKMDEIPIMVIILLWGIHFLRRFGEVLFLHEYHRTFSFVESVGSVIYYSFFGFWIGWSLNFNKSHDKVNFNYRPPAYALVGLGALLVFIGEIGNCSAHVSLCKLRTNSRSNRTPIAITSANHILPNGFLFKYISCPHYLFEIITWLGFFVATCTLSSAVFLLCGFVTMVFYARKKHKEYLREFDGQDGRPDYKLLNRKMLIPCVY